MPVTSQQEIAAHARFAFGQNWQRFLSLLDESRISRAQESLRQMLEVSDLHGRTFLDIGCGSGLFSLAARRLGARVHSFDYDPQSVACARELRARYFPEDANWRVEEGSALDTEYLTGLGAFDVVYSWGVLHHTGAMWRAIDRAASMVAADGLLALALYRRTPLCGLWRIEKRLYARAPRWAQSVIRGLFKIAYVMALAASGRNPCRYIAAYVGNRGMDWRHDVHDWLGGYPYESVRPVEVKRRLAATGFETVKIKETHPPLAGLLGTGCDEFIARRGPCRRTG